MNAKKIFVWVLMLLLPSAPSFGREFVITRKELPQAAQIFISTKFKDKKVMLVKKEMKMRIVNYDVMLNDGTKLKFDGKGEWTEIDCKPSAVPATLVPTAIVNYVKKNYPNVKIIQIERDRWGYEIDLSNGFDIRFNKQFKVVEIDD